MNEEFWSYSIEPVVHELTHVICQDYWSLSLREGLACYLNDEAGFQPTIFNYGMDANSLCENIVFNSDYDCDGIISELGTETIESQYANGKERGAYYICAYSFAKYIIETYGMETFMNIYQSDEGIDAYQIETGKTLAILKREWKDYLTIYDGDITLEQYNEQLENLTGN